METHSHTKRAGFMVSYQMQREGAARPDPGVPMPDGTVENHRVISMGDANSSIVLDWWNTGKVAFYLHGREPTHLTLQVTYPRPVRVWQGVELVGWSFFLSNLKSVAMKGPDLRTKNPRLSWKKGYVD